MHLTIGEEHHGEAHGKDEEDNVAHKGFPADLELADEGHGASNDGGDEASCTYQLAYGHATAVRVHGSKGAEDVGRTIPKGQKGDTSQALRQAKDTGDGAEVDAEEVARGDADGGEEQTEPEGQQGKSYRLHLGEGTEVEGEIGEQAWFIFETICANEGALILGLVDIVANLFGIPCKQARRRGRIGGPVFEEQGVCGQQGHEENGRA